MHAFYHVGVPGNEGADALASASLDQPIAGAQASTTGPVNHPNPANLPHAPHGADEFYCASTAVGGGTPITYTDTATTGAGGTSYCTAQTTQLTGTSRLATRAATPTGGATDTTTTTGHTTNTTVNATTYTGRQTRQVGAGKQQLGVIGRFRRTETGGR